MLPLAREELISHQDAKVCDIRGKIIPKKFAKDKNYQKVREHCHYTGKPRGAAHSTCNLKFNVIHNSSNYDYHFIIKELANEFEEQFECFGENKEKNKTFSIPMKNEIKKIDKDGNERVVTISYKIKFIDSARFMTTSLSNLVDNLSDGIHKIKCKDCDCFLEYESVQDNLIKYKFYLAVKIIQTSLMKN